MVTLSHLAAPRTGEARNLEARLGPFFRIPAATVVAIFTVSKLKLQWLRLSVSGNISIQSADSRLSLHSYGRLIFLLKCILVLVRRQTDRETL